ncbi:MAG TPA: fumarylacetoacetate hydrolase family protein [Steroidobacteraceae bacterium]|jgi:2-keto-4-pentenoate hydratase/2-oxohepta-3-ene-1,7-dioic acid hydratase in catechol pathway
MRFLTFKSKGEEGIGILDSAGAVRGFLASDQRYPGNLDKLIGTSDDALHAAGALLQSGKAFDQEKIDVLPPLSAAAKIICIGLNYAAHTQEGGFAPQTYPAVFTRFNSSLIGHRAPLLRPRVSDKLDYEGELVAVIGRGGRHIAKDAALSHVIGYSVFNDGSIRDYQMKTAQWTVGKNFDGTGAFGPYLVTADELPSGAAGLRLQTRLNGQTVQDANTSDLIFDVATLVSTLSEAFTLQRGDIIVTGTPSGVGFARKPPLYMKAGDVCEIEIEGVGTLVNPVVDESA